MSYAYYHEYYRDCENQPGSFDYYFGGKLSEYETIRWDDDYEEPVPAQVYVKLRRTFWQALLGYLTLKPNRFATIEYEIEFGEHVTYWRTD